MRESSPFSDYHAPRRRLGGRRAEQAGRRATHRVRRPFCVVTAQASRTSPETIDNPIGDRNTHSMSSLAMEIDLALRRLDPSNAARLERLLRDGLALALG